ncbi:MAG: amino acid carrier protein [Oscillospiraceae bacterium]|jgi:AGCS family alanine or glycine:cation symporter|nr:amino acid carrier protein [Oscillospiraceae bacterium]
MPIFEKITRAIDRAAAFVWGPPMLILLVATHLFLTVRTGFVQRRIFHAIRLSVKKSGGNGEVSPLSALATSLAATIGTGNIIGVAASISLGGAGAVFWCWLTGIFAMATKYGETFLAIVFRVRTPTGLVGGPMYTIERGLGAPRLAKAYALFCALAALAIGAATQSNSMVSAIAEEFFAPGNPASGTPRLALIVTAAATALVAGLIIIGGLKKIGAVCTLLVPLMAVFYAGGCFAVLFLNRAFLLPALRQIVVSALNPRAIGGGFAGGAFIAAMRYGVSRGLFSNESGLGSAAITAASAKTDSPGRQALITMTATFWDTVVVCALTGLCLVSEIARNPDAAAYTDGARLTFAAFSRLGTLGPKVLTAALAAFAFSTIIGWYINGERASEYLNRKSVPAYRLIYIAAVFLGGILPVSAVWGIADCLNGAMAVPNIASLVLLSGVLAKKA